MNEQKDQVRVESDAATGGVPGNQEYEFSQLPLEDQHALLRILESGNIDKLEDERERELLWQRRHFLTGMPEALPFVLAAVDDWSIAFLPGVYEILEAWAPLPPVVAIQLLLPTFPDERVREQAVRWLEASTAAATDFVHAFLPQLIESLRFECHENSALASFLLRLSDRDGAFAISMFWQLQQRIDHCDEAAGDDVSYAQRAKWMQVELMRRHAGGALCEQIARQRRLLASLDELQAALAQTTSGGDVAKLRALRAQMGVMDAQLLETSVSLPIAPSFICSGINVQECSIFNSKTKPLRVVFRGLRDKYAIIHKHGDDMRQDALVLQLVSLMNDVWMERGLDLRMIVFKILPVGKMKGMAELVPDCSTLCDIHKSNGLKGVFADEGLYQYLEKHNSNEFLFRQAQDNFTRSCAGWCVATYLLGIGDRHNDNILMTTRGHVFHIDFGKYMGDWQMAGSFKRDRVPFVFTPDMYYVVNRGLKQTQNNQTFIDYCTRAYNFLRARSSAILNLLNMMRASGIPGINTESILFVENNLRLDLTENEATVEFTQMLQSSLESAFPRLNFAIHTMAQVFSGGKGADDVRKLSFVPMLYTQQTDGRITQVRVIGIEKRSRPSKVYMYKMQVLRCGQAVPSTIYRSAAEFHELATKLRRAFPGAMLPPLSKSGGSSLPVAQRKQLEVQSFIGALFNQAPEVTHAELVYTFFHSLLRDNAEPGGEHEDDENGGNESCHVHVKLCYSQTPTSQLSIFISHGKNLKETATGSAPDSYIKTYLRPDKQKSTKQKSQIVRASCNPTYNAEIIYTLFETPAMLSQQILELSIWYANGLLDNQCEYCLFYPLKKLADVPPDRRGARSHTDWFELRRATKFGGHR